MATRERRPERRQEPLSRERIIGAAVELLDTAGERGLTFRALAERLATGPGAIYWHVTGKAELLAAATDAVIAPAVAPADAEATPEQAIRTLALGIFDALDTHPWVGFYSSPSPSATHPCCGSSKASGGRSRRWGCRSPRGSPPRRR